MCVSVSGAAGKARCRREPRTRQAAGRAAAPPPPRSTIDSPWLAGPAGAPSLTRLSQRASSLGGRVQVGGPLRGLGGPSREARQRKSSVCQDNGSHSSELQSLPRTLLGLVARAILRLSDLSRSGMGQGICPLTSTQVLSKLLVRGSKALLVWKKQVKPVIPPRPFSCSPPPDSSCP